MRITEQQTKNLSRHFLRVVKERGGKAEDIPGLLSISSYRSFKNWLVGSNRMTATSAQSIRGQLKEWGEDPSPDSTITALLSLAKELTQGQRLGLIQDLLEDIAGEGHDDV